MFKPLIVFSILLSTNLAFSAENIVSEFYFPMSRKALDTLMQDSLSGSMNQQIPEFSIEEPYKTNIRGIQVSFDYSYKIHSEKRKGLTTDFSAQISNLKIDVGSVKTKDVERRTMGNVTLDVKIEGACQDIQLIPDEEALDLGGQLHLTNKEGSFPTVKAVLGDLQWPEAWDVGSPDCEGPAGYQEAVQTAIEEGIFARKSELEKLIEEEINKVASQSMANVMNRVSRPIHISVSDNVDINFQPQEVYLDSESGGVLLQGEVVAASKYGQGVKPQVVPFSLSEQAVQQYLKNTGLVMSNTFIEHLIDLVYRSGDLKTRFQSQNIEGLRKLHRSRIYQFFVFPDLMKFSKSANFLLDTFIGQSPKIKFNTQWEDKTWFQYQTEVKIKMLAPKPKGYVPYMYYKLPVTGNLWLNVDNHHLVMGFGKPNTLFKSYWDGNYLKTYKTSRRFSSGLFHREITKQLQQQMFKIYIPSIELDSFTSLNPTRLVSNDHATQLRFSIKTTNGLQAAK